MPIYVGGCICPSASPLKSAWYLSPVVALDVAVVPNQKTTHLGCTQPLATVTRNTYKTNRFGFDNVRQSGLVDVQNRHAELRSTTKNLSPLHLARARNGAAVLPPKNEGGGPREVSSR